MELKTKLEQYITGTGETQAAISKKIGISGAALSQYLGDKYPTPQSIEPKIEEFLKHADQAGEVVKKPDFVRTSITDEITMTIGYCHIQKEMGIIYGDAGIGKTMAINRYEEEHGEVVVLRMAKAYAKPSSFLKVLAHKLRITEGKRQDEMYMEIVDKLCGSEKVLIIDEAQHLPYTTLEFVRNIHDDAGVGVVLVGNHEIYSKMFGRGEAAFAQLFSRIAMRRQLFTVQVKMEDIEKLFKGVGEEEHKFLLNVARTKWGIRGAVFVYLNSANNGDLSKNGMEKMAKYMGIGL